MTKTIELIGGYTEKGVTHRRVTFGKRLTAKTLFDIDVDPQSALPTQHIDLIHRAAITEFGTLTCPVRLAVLLDLDSIDREDLAAAYGVFQVESAGGREGKAVSDTVTQWAFGYERDGSTYDRIEFGRRLTGRDEVAADQAGLTELARRVWLAGRQVARLAQSKGAMTLEGPLELDALETLDSADVVLLMGGAERYRQSFRQARP